MNIKVLKALFRLLFVPLCVSVYFFQSKFDDPFDVSGPHIEPLT